MCICIYTYIYTYIYIDVYIYLYRHIYRCIHIYTRSNLYVRVSTQVCPLTHTAHSLVTGVEARHLCEGNVLENMYNTYI